MSEQRCGTPSLFRYTWPGRDEAFVCVEHARGLQAVAGALGLHLQLIMLTPDQLGDAPPCTQIVRPGDKEREHADH